MDWTIVLSGPLNARPPLLKALERAAAGMQDMPPDDEPPSHGLAAGEPTVGWVTVLHADIDQIADLAKKHRWALRMHWPTPKCKVCSGHAVRNGKPCPYCLGVGKTNRKPVAPEPVDVHALVARLAELERQVGHGA